MRLLFSLLMSLQFISAPLAAELGQKQEISSKSLLAQQLAAAMAGQFESHIRKSLKDIAQFGLDKHLKQYRLAPAGEDQKLLEQVKKASQPAPALTEVKKGHWEAQVKGVKITFSLLDLYQDKVLVDGTPFSFKGKGLVAIHQELEKLLQPKSTWYQGILNNTLFISEAQAAFPIVAVLMIAGVIFVAAYAKHAYGKYVEKPRKTAETFNDLTKDLSAKAGQCESAGSSASSYEATFEVAKAIGGSASYSTTNASDALLLMLKSQIEEGNFNNEECFSSLHRAGDSLGMSLPDVNSEAFKRRRQRLLEYQDVISPDPKSNADSLITLCNAYNRLSSCMSKFVGIHVNNEEIEDFEDEAYKSFEQYRRKQAASKQ